MVGPRMYIASITLRRIKSNYSHGSIQEPMPSVIGATEMDNYADTCCLGQNFVVLSYTHRMGEVFAYDDTLPSTTVPIVSGATAYTSPELGTT